MQLNCIGWQSLFRFCHYNLNFSIFSINLEDSFFNSSALAAMIWLVSDTILAFFAPQKRFPAFFHEVSSFVKDSVFLFLLKIFL